MKPIIARSSGSGDFEIPEEGVYLARCYRMVDVGTQTKQSQWGTKETREVYIWWELLADADGGAVKMIDGKPLTIMNSYTLSLGKKANLRKHIDAWRGKALTEDEAEEFDITKLLDKFCLLQVVHKVSGDKTYANIGTLMSTKRTVDGVNPISMFTVDDPDMNEYAKLPEFIQKKIDVAPESSEPTINAADYPEDDQQSPDDEVPGSDLPF